LNTDAAEYGGSGIGNLGSVEAEAEAVPHWERSFSLRLRLPPLATVILQPRTAGS
jgi:1,4-alpha-glucan branching enzyme